jgi:phage baseplate assembly protein W
MSESDARLGTDLRLLHDLERQNSRSPGQDLGTIRVERQPGVFETDLEKVSGVLNMQQALLLRFLTPLGELAPLGHPEYGSRLFELIGELNTDRTRNRAKLYVLQALHDEPRVKTVSAVSVTQNQAVRERIDIKVGLLPVDSDTALNLIFPFFLEAGATARQKDGEP